MKALFLSTILTISMFAAPPRRPPQELLERYTLNGKIPIVYHYRNDTVSSQEPTIYTQDQVDKNIEIIKKNGCNYYGKTDKYLYAAFNNFKDFIAGKEVAVIGSTIPWYESIVLAYGGRPVTIEYNKIISQVKGHVAMTVEEYKKNPKKFDVVLSISSYEHDGLGRYGDPLNPDGDLEAMQATKDMLNENGLLFLAVPVGKDKVVWNLHRFYGQIRLPMLLNGYDVVSTHGFKKSDLTVNCNPRYTAHQPVFVLRPKK